VRAAPLESPRPAGNGLNAGSVGRAFGSQSPAGRAARRFACRLLAGFVAAASPVGPAAADSSTPALASYYDRHMAICGGDAYQWEGETTPTKALSGAVKVGVGRKTGFALARDGRLHAWGDDFRAATVVIDGVRDFAAGDSGILATRTDGSLWLVEAAGSGWPARGAGSAARIASDVRAASVGDGTNYHVTANGDLFAKGRAHRGQYGNGTLEGTDTYVRVASRVVEVRSHTGHALLLTDRGEVLGTGGNIHGPLGRHGLGDKAIRWAPVFGGATGIATGASHSLAIEADGTLWIWGRNEGPEPRSVLTDVVGAAAGSDSSIALTRDGSLWQWSPGKRPVKIFDCAR
jgi:alpha-tubulin suppressor-like RCC1 family protein